MSSNMVMMTVNKLYTPIHLLYIILACVIHLKLMSPVYGKSITLSLSRQEDCITNCSKGLISGIDIVVFKCNVNYVNDPNLEFVQFYVKKKTERAFNFIRSYNVKECDSKKNFECTRLSQFMVNISIRIQALTDYNGGEIFGELVTNSIQDKRSETQLFPLIYDSSTVDSELIINGHKIQQDDDKCFMDVPEKYVHIVFNCRSEVSPCLIEIVFDNEGKHVKGIETINLTKTKYIGESFTVFHAVCSMDKNIHIKRCSKSEVNTLISPWTFAVVVVFILGIATIAMTAHFLW
ncbi:unnamed protein product, partial [Lymnaea stagnalis]